METLDSRVKRIEQRLATIEKFIAENFQKNKNRDISTTLGSVSEPIESKKNYHYDYSKEIDYSNQPKVVLHKVDTSVFKQNKVITVTDDTLTVLAYGLFIIAAIYFGAKIVMDGNWLSPVSQVSLAALIGMVLVGLGFVLTNTLEQYSKYFPILGTVVLYMAALGASGLYKVLPNDAALVVMLLVSALSVYMGRRFNMQVYHFIAVVGGYIIPLYLVHQESSGFVNFFYLGISLLFMIMSVSFRITSLVVMGAYLSLIVCAISEYVDNDTMNLVFFTLGHFVIYTSAYILNLVRSEEPLNKLYSVSFFTFVLIFFLTEYYYIESLKLWWAPLFTAITSLLLFVCYFCVQKFAAKHHSFTAVLILSLASSTAIHTVFYVLAPERFRPISLVIASVVVVKILEKLKDLKWELYCKFMVYCTIGLIGLNYFEVIFSQFNSKSILPVINGFIYAALFLYLSFFEKKVLDVKLNPIMVTGAAHVIILSSLYNLTKGYSMTLWGSVTVIYFLSAVTSLFFLEKIQNKLD